MKSGEMKDDYTQLTVDNYKIEQKEILPQL